MRTITAIAVLLCLPPAAIGSVGGNFLTISPGARPASLGGAYTALADDVQGIAVNPAGLGRMPRGGFSFSHLEWITGMRYELSLIPL